MNKYAIDGILNDITKLLSSYYLKKMYYFYYLGDKNDVCENIIFASHLL